MPLRFNSLLRDEGVDPAQVRLLRHQTGRVPGRTPYALWRDDRAGFERYQSIQNAAKRMRPRFQSPYWAGFVAPPGGGTLFVGLYRSELIGRASPDTIDPLTGGVIGAVEGGEPIPCDLYRCEPASELSDYAGRLLIHWGDSPSANRAWVQRAGQQDKLIVELRRAFQEEQFPGFTKFLRPLSEVATMPSAWREVLRSARGVYLLTCPRTREHYVGSASGTDGFLGRWLGYVATGHGGNVGLRLRDPSDYVISVLEVAGSNATADDILTLETIWKVKLQSRDIGLNFN